MDHILGFAPEHGLSTPPKRKVILCHEVGNGEETNRGYLAACGGDGGRLKQGIVGVCGNFTGVPPHIGLLKHAPYPLTVAPAGNKRASSSSRPRQQLPPERLSSFSSLPTDSYSTPSCVATKPASLSTRTVQRSHHTAYLQDACSRTGLWPDLLQVCGGFWEPSLHLPLVLLTPGEKSLFERLLVRFPAERDPQRDGDHQQQQQQRGRDAHPPLHPSSADSPRKSASAAAKTHSVARASRARCLIRHPPTPPAVTSPPRHSRSSRVPSNGENWSADHVTLKRNLRAAR